MSLANECAGVCDESWDDFDIRTHHEHDDVDGGGNSARVAELPAGLPRAHGGAARDPLGKDLRTREQAADPRPHQQAQVHVVPDGDKGEDGPDVGRLEAAAAQRDVHVPHEPPVEAGVPVAPEALDVVVVVDAPAFVMTSVVSYSH